MATLQPSRRHPFFNKTPYNGHVISLSKSVDSGSLVKRARSPDHTDQQGAKRVRSNNTTASADPDKKRRIELENEFKTKYRQSFPTWKFYFDEDHLDTSLMKELKSRVVKLGGTIEGFFSAKITHVITDQPKPQPAKNKENELHNKHQPTPVLLGSPIKLNAFSLTDKAFEYGQKIWDSRKLDSVTTRCLAGPVKKSATTTAPPRTTLSRPQPAQRSTTLERLLLKERIHGTSERDPNQKRHDYRYFTKNAVFVLIEDIRGELSPLATYEFAPLKDKDKPGKTPWPALHCHPQSRNPFAPLEDKDLRRWERAQLAKKEQATEHAKRRRKEQATEHAKRRRKEQERGVMALRRGLGGPSHVAARVDLRRAVSMGNLRRQHTEILANASIEDDSVRSTPLDLDDDYATGTARASGFLPSGQSRAHIAASGNSVTITSAAGTTSAAGHLLRPNQTTGVLHDRPHVVTNMRMNRMGSITLKEEVMGPPPTLPPRVTALKKSKSTNTMRLPKRDEAAKPGYCENCRVKFDDFQEHIHGRRHRRFAEDPNNFATVDALLSRLQRRTHAQVKEEEEERNRRFLDGQLAERRYSHRSR